MARKKRNEWLKTLALVGVFLLAMNWQSLSEAVRGAPRYDAALAGPVTLYGTTWCGYCRKTRHFLNTHDIPYRDLDIEQSRPARRNFERLGGRGVPVVTVGDRVIHGFDLGRLRAALECEHCTGH